MEHNAELILYLIIHQMMRTGEILFRAKQLLSESAFASVLVDHAISPQQATMAMEMFEEVRQITHY